MMDLQPGLAADTAYRDFLARLGSQIIKSSKLESMDTPDSAASAGEASALP
jgi:hypothetical protein